MKKKDWMDQLPPPPAPGTGDGAYQGWKLVVAAHTEKAGVVWDPEEPELPERVLFLEMGIDNIFKIVNADTSDFLGSFHGSRAGRELVRSSLVARQVLGKLRKWLEEEAEHWRRRAEMGTPQYARSVGVSAVLDKLDSLLQEEP